jgi:hypothetical protein
VSSFECPTRFGKGVPSCAGTASEARGSRSVSSVEGFGQTFGSELYRRPGMTTREGTP